MALALDAGKELGDGIRDNELNSLPPLGIPSSFGLVTALRVRVLIGAARSLLEVACSSDSQQTV